MGTAAVGAVLGAVIGFFGGVYLVTALGIQPGDRTDLLVIALVVSRSPRSAS